MVEEEDERFARYDKPTSSEEEIVYEEPNPLEKAKEYAQKAAEVAGGAASGARGYEGAVKKGVKRIIIGIIILAIAYLALDFFVLSNKQFSIGITDTEGKPITGALSIYSENSSTAIFSGAGQANYSVSLKLGNYRFEANAGTNYKAFNSTLNLTAENPAIKIEIEKNAKLKITNAAFPSELYAGQQTEALVSIENQGDQAAEAELVFEGALKEFGKEGVYSEPQTIVLPTNSTAQATIKIAVPASISIKDKTKGDSKNATIRIKFLNESEEISFTLYPAPFFIVSPTSISTEIAADSDNKPVKDITVENKGSFPLKGIVLSIEADEATKNWFSFQPYSKIDSLDAKGGQQTKQTIKLWVRVPIGTPQETLSPNLVVSTAGAEKTIPIVLKVKAVKLDFVATASKDTINIPKDAGDAFKEIISETIRLQNKGVVDIHNIDLSVDIACRDNWISFPQGAHIDTVTKGTTEEVAMLVTAPAGAEINKSITCQITVKFDNPLDPTETKQQVISLFLVPKS